MLAKVVSEKRGGDKHDVTGIYVTIKPSVLRTNAKIDTTTVKRVYVQQLYREDRKM